MRKQRRSNETSLTLAKPIAKCGVLYLGSAVPKPNILGLESIQSPLSRRYPTDSSNSVYGIDSILLVRENGIELSFVQDSQMSIFYPVEALVYCASVRFSSLPKDGSKSVQGIKWPFNTHWGFVPLDSPFAQLNESQRHPPVFCAVFKRTRNVAAEECHCFITKTKESAMVLVQACFTAFSTQQKLHPNRFHSNALSGKRIPIYIKSASHPNHEFQWYEVDQSHIRVIEAPTKTPVVDFMTNPTSDGFFYTSNNAVIDTWQLWEERMKPANSIEEEKKSLVSSDQSSFESSTEYYQNVVDGVIPKDIEEDVKQANHGNLVDPYEPAPNLIKVEHKRDPVTGANIFVRWFQKEDEEENQNKNLPPAPKINRQNTSSTNMIIEEVEIKKSDQKRSKLKGILRNNGKTAENTIKYGKVKTKHESIYDKNAYQITEAYFEDTKGHVHEVTDDKGRLPYEILSDDASPKRRSKYRYLSNSNLYEPRRTENGGRHYSDEYFLKDRRNKHRSTSARQNNEYFKDSQPHRSRRHRRNYDDYNRTMHHSSGHYNTVVDPSHVIPLATIQPPMSHYYQPFHLYSGM